MPRIRPVRRLGLIAALGLVAAPLAAPPATADVLPSSALVINEVYGGGGNNGATFTHDFVELYNKGTSPISLATYSLQYRSAGGTTWSGQTNLTGLIAPGSHYLVQLAVGSAGTTALPAPDATGTTSVSSTAGAFALASSQARLACAGSACATDDAVVDLVGFGAANTFAGSAPAPAASNTTSVARTAFANTADNLADFVAGAPTPRNSGGGGGGVTPPGIGVCGDPATLISAVQGPGATSPLVGSSVIVEAVVTSVQNGLSGYYVQEQVWDRDADETTSEGVFVRSGSSDNSTVAMGSLVRVRGTVAEFSGSGSSQTQLTSPQVATCAAPAATAPIQPTPVTFPLDAADDLEHVEGMLVTLTDSLVISEYFNYDRFGEVSLAKPLDGQDRLFTPTAVVEPGADAQALAAEYERRIITLDDASSAQNPRSIPHPGNGDPFSATNTFRGGDTVTGVQGVVDHTFGLYRLQPTAYGTYAAVNPRPETAPEVGGDVQVASFNVLNYFLTLDAGPDICGAGQNLECRGADNAEEFDRQRAKILAALTELDADVVGLIEMENTPGVESAADLAAGLNEVLGEGTYDFVDTGVVGTDAIRVGFLYKPAVVTPVGDFAVLDSSVDPRFIDTKSRPMISQTFDEVSTGEVFTASINHLKSKGSRCNDVGDPDTGDGQANCNQTRTAAAGAIVDFLATDPTGSGDPDHLVIGDLNSYDKEDPIDALVAGGYTDLIKEFGGEFAYGYVFDGQVGYLDHALSTDSLTGQVTGAQEWNINADEPDILDYNLDFDRSSAYFTDDAYRSSDHDAVLVGLDLQAPAPTTCFGLEPTIVAPDGGGVVTGTDGDDVILAYDGDYTVFADNGNDVVCAGDGDTTVYGGNGNDRIETGDGDDTLYGGNGDDVLVGGGNDDRLFGGNGDDVLDGGRGDDVLDGGKGSTTVR